MDNDRNRPFHAGVAAPAAEETPMKAQNSGVETIDDYIRGCAPGLQNILAELRSTIQRAAPDATEKISYQMPTFYQNGNLVHFAAFERHVGFYPTPSAIDEFKKELRRYNTSKGAVQFPIDEPLPLKLVTKMVKFRVAENARKKPRAKKTSK
jgi:uncharacterized protein YdhG (YjbR/CyaY superfamily)